MSSVMALEERHRNEAWTDESIFIARLSFVATISMQKASFYLWLCWMMLYNKF